MICWLALLVGLAVLAVRAKELRALPTIESFTPRQTRHIIFFFTVHQDYLSAATSLSPSPRRSNPVINAQRFASARSLSDVGGSTEIADRRGKQFTGAPPIGNAKISVVGCAT